MGSGAARSAAFIFLIIHVLLYGIVIIIASWAVNYGIERPLEAVPRFPMPFPIIGNMATGFFIIFALVAGVVGFMTSLTGIHNIIQWDAANLHSAAASSLATWSLTLLAMGLACKEIHLGWTDSNLRTLEVFVIILSGTQLLCLGAIHAGVEDMRRGNL